jgi:hypothetical protein
MPGAASRLRVRKVLSQIWPTDPPGVRFAGDDFGGECVMIKFKGSHFERDVILWTVRWYVAYPISYRELEEKVEQHGVEVDHATLHHWVLKCVSLSDHEFRARKRPVGPSWRMYRAVDKAGAMVDFAVDRQAGSQSRAAVPAQGDQVERNAREDHDRQEWRQHSGDRKPQWRT